MQSDIRLITGLLLMYLGVPIYGLEKDKAILASGALDRLFHDLIELRKSVDPSQDVAEVLCKALEADEYEMMRKVVLEVSVASNAKSLWIHTQCSVNQVCELEQFT